MRADKTATPALALASSYYEATVERGSVPPPSGGHESARVCVVGGGFAGLNTALGLVERGERDIVVLEAAQVGYGASGRNGGFVFGGFSLDNAELLRQLGPCDARLLYTLTTNAIDLIRTRIERYRIECEATHAGVILADWFGEPEALEAQRKMMRTAFGVEWEPIARDELQQRLKSRRYHGGLCEPRAFHFHPLKYALGLARALSEAGVRIREGTRAVAIERSGKGFSVRTPNGSVEAEHIVMAVGGYARGVYRRIERAVLPIATYVVATEPLGVRLAEAIACRSAVYDTRFAFDYYRPLSDTRLLWGGRISIFERQPRQIARLLTRDLLRVYPQLRGVKIDYAWGGLMSYARHKMPQIGHTADKLWHAVGFGGHGLAPTTAAGELLAAAIAEGRPLPAPFARYGLEPVHGPLGLAAAELAYLTKIGKDALADIARRGA